jgi:TP901 family phage tail tape measure protein
MAASETARLIAELSLSDKLTPGVKKATGSISKLESSISRVGRGTGQLASGFAKAGTRIAAGIGIGLAGAAKAAIDWEDAFTGVEKTVDASSLAKGQTFDDLALALRQMATEMPNTAAELAGIAEQAGAMGIAGKDIEAFTRQVAILASTTNVGAEDAATALGQLTNVIGLQGDEFDNFTASLVDLGNKGSSTEAQILEITRRAGGAAKLFGIAKEETLGWASAAANLGLNEELAGTALQNVFIKLLPKYTKGAKDLQTITGKTAKQLKKDFKEDAGGAIEDLIAQLGQLPKDRRLAAVQDLFGKGSGLTRLVLGLAESYKTNLAPSLDTATESWEAATAAQIEFEKKNATVKSAISRLKNGIYEAGITLGEGFVPALGNAATKLSEFLAQGQNREALKSIGRDIGKAIDDIDWKQVVDGAKSLVDVMKMALDFAKRLYDAFNLLPTPLKGAAVGLVALDKLSGGLVGAGAGGVLSGLGNALAKSLAASIPIFGRAFVQPVFVTNMVPGGGLGSALPGGAAAAGGAAAGIGTAAALVPIAAGVAVSVLATMGFAERNNAQEREGLTQAERVAVNYYASDKTQQQNIYKRLGYVPDKKDANTGNRKLEDKVNGLNVKFGRFPPAIDKVKVAAQETKREAARGLAIVRSQTQSSGAAIQGTTRSSAAGIEAAVRASRPIITVDVDVSSTNVTRVNTKTTRSGPTSGSRNADSSGSGTLGNGGR